MFKVQLVAGYGAIWLDAPVIRHYCLIATVGDGGAFPRGHLPLLVALIMAVFICILRSIVSFAAETVLGHSGAS